MSLSYVGNYRLKLKDEQMSLYVYWGENWNIPNEEQEQIQNPKGYFTISKACLDQFDARGLPDINTLIAEGEIVIDKLCGVDDYLNSHSFRKNHILQHVLYALFEDYKSLNDFPERGSFIQ